MEKKTVIKKSHAAAPKLAKTKASSSTAMRDKPAKLSLDLSLYNQKGASAGTFAMPKKVFGLAWNADLVHQVVVAMQANKRAGTAHSKDRSEVSGGGKKPWKQKGTGRARHGSTRSPLWVGGGTTFGPRNDKDYSQKINKKMRVKALFTILSRKFTDNAVLLVDAIAFDAIKTKAASATLALKSLGQKSQRLRSWYFLKPMK
jgi:large subunit ribosomal protein L4